MASIGCCAVEAGQIPVSIAVEIEAASDDHWCREGFTWAGAERISKMAEWPDWNPPSKMIDRQPDLPRFMTGG